MGADHIHEIRKALVEWKSAKPISILVFGVYDAGKTTLVNAITGADLAVGGIPTTRSIDRVSTHRFGEFLFVDTPGLNAPGIEDDVKVRIAAQYEADLVLFLIRSTETLDQEFMWKELQEMAGRGKPLLLVFNEDDDLDEDPEFRVRLADNIRRRCHGLINAGSIRGPFFVNALSALNARRSSSPKPLLEVDSNILELEREISDWVASTGRDAGLQKVGYRLENFLKAARASLDEELSESDPPRLGALKGLDEVEAQFKTTITQEIDSVVEDLRHWGRGFIYSLDPKGNNQHAINGYANIVEPRKQHIIDSAQSTLNLLLFRLIGEPLPKGSLEAALQSQTPSTAFPMILPPPNRFDAGRPPAVQGIESIREENHQSIPNLKAPTVALASKALREAGVLRSLAQKGALGKLAANGVRFAPPLVFP